MNRLLEIGFEPAGHWKVDEGRLNFILTRHSTQTNILYAFVCDGIVMYVGKTIQPLSKRMGGYRTPSKTQITNINNHTRIVERVERRSAVEILALPDNGLMHYGQFHINMAAALEDDIIRKLDPPWNGGKTERVGSVLSDTVEPNAEAPSEETTAFTFTLQPTYFRSGFFNVGVAAQTSVGADGETIELFLGDAHHPLLGVINRTANTNGTPRILGGTKLRDWFQTHARELCTINVDVRSPTSIRLTVRNVAA